jgi:hypothetical protein
MQQVSPAVLVARAEKTSTQNVVNMYDAKEEAVRLLQHYMERAIGELCGSELAEIGQIVDLVVDAALAKNSWSTPC